MSFTQAMQGRPQAAPQQQQPGAGGGGQLAQMAQQAASACGQLIQAMHQVPSIDSQQLETAAAQLRQSLMAVAQIAKTAGAQAQQPQGAAPPTPGG